MTSLVRAICLAVFTNKKANNAVGEIHWINLYQSSPSMAADAGSSPTETLPKHKIILIILSSIKENLSWSVCLSLPNLIHSYGLSGKA